MPKHLVTGSLKTINGASIEGTGNVALATFAGGSASKYIDVGDARICWGTTASGTLGATTITFPAAFADTTYSVSGNCLNSTTTYILKLTSLTTTSFTCRTVTTTDAGTAGVNISWMAIGKKP